MTSIPSKHNPLFRNAAKAFLDKGWPANALLPGIPIGATMLPASHVKIASIGKVPGEWLGTMWKGMEGAWASKGLAGATAGQGRAKKPLDPAAIETWPTEQICISGYEACGLDIDGGADVVDIVRRIFDAWAGEDAASVRGRDDGSARCMVPFRPAGGPGSIPSSSVTFVRGAERAMVEVKGKGHHWTGAGGHPEGCSYMWTEGVPAFDALPALDVETVSLMRQAIIKDMERAGWVLSTQHVSGGGKEQSVLNARCLISPATVSAIMAGAENNLDWEDAVSIFSALRGAMGSEGGVPPDGVYEWTMKHPAGNHDWLDRRWNSLEVVRSGVGAVVKWLNNPTRGNRPDLVALLDGEADRTRALNVLDADEEAAAEPGERLGKLKEDRDAAVVAIVEGWVYCEPEDTWMRIASRGEAGFEYRLGFNQVRECKKLSAIDHEIIKLRPRRPDAAEPPPRSAAKILHSFEYCGKLQRVAGLISSYGDEVLMRCADGMDRLNSAVMNDFEVVEGVTDEDVRPFLDHLAALVCNSEADQAVILDWFAWVLQNPKEKVRWAIVLLGMFGSGKNSLIDFLVDAVGGWNHWDLNPAELKAGVYNEHLGKRLVVVAETPQSDKVNIGVALKSAIGGGSSGMANVNPKYGRKYKAVDRSCYLIDTNYANAIAFEENDRRFHVVKTRDVPPGGTPERIALNEEMLALNNWRKAGGWRPVASWLLLRDVSRFNASYPPPPTQAKRDMEMAAAPVFSRWFQEVIEDGQGLWGERTVLSPGAVVSRVRRTRDLDPELRSVSGNVTEQQVADALRRAGWHRVGSVKLSMKGGQGQKRITAYVRDGEGEGIVSAVAARFVKEEAEHDEREKRAQHEVRANRIWLVPDADGGVD